MIDYQNVHLTARDTFAPPGTRAQDTLVSPGLFAERLISKRAAAMKQAEDDVDIQLVRAFRGAPSNRHEPQLYAASQSQRAQWTRDRRVQVEYRTLRYTRKWPDVPAREKGVDVRIALEFVHLAQLGTYDVLVLAAHDTDLEPALDMAVETGKSKIETAGWEGAKRLHCAPGHVWHTSLDGQDFMACRDRRNYW